jgi:hypothetical protein
MREETESGKRPFKEGSIFLNIIYQSPGGPKTKPIIAHFLKLLLSSSPQEFSPRIFHIL